MNFFLMVGFKLRISGVGSNQAANYAATTKLNQTFCILTSNWCLFKKRTSLFVLQNIFFIKLNKSFELFIH